ncbi:transcription termination/antitermination protein NusA [Clostridiales bacterium BX7]|uniref:Transcription termination/antitermination protein NusA n=1 Tax=Feifania hominis TaxID=2763660 RepID=A0A926DEH6_9FIRM|nr:transcription termination/antitermination protein NusA [Feifania hominis]
MNSELFEALELLAKETGIPKDYLMSKIEAALLSAYRRDYGAQENVSVTMNPEKNEIKLMQRRTAVEEVTDPITEIQIDEARKISKRTQIGDEVETELKTKNFGRISAQTAKQVIIQGIREAERGLVYQEFVSKEQEILTGVVQRVDPRSVVIEVGKTELFLMSGEQIPGESFREGQRVRVYVVEVKSTTKGPQIIISRTHPGFVKRLFELEVPEIYDGVVEIRSISREAGSRTKIAVYSSDENVDPIGACIGPKGARVSSIVSELGGEKIDILKYSDDPTEFIAQALSPAEVIQVIPLEGEKNCRVIVPDDQLSLAIGKEGQNARLAAKLTGYKIDIRPLSNAEF